MIDEVPRFLSLERCSHISGNSRNSAPTLEEARASFLRAAFALCDTIKKLIAGTRGKI